MKKYFILCFLFIPSFANATIVNWQFVKVVDGDTIAFVNKQLPKEIEKIAVRVIEIDTPESNHLAKCEKEKQLGIKAKEYVKSIVKSDNIKVDVKQWDKYGGRVNGIVYVNSISLKDILIEKGYARHYSGGKKSNWCE